MPRGGLWAVWPMISMLLCLTVFLCYQLRPDFCAAMTVVPPWIWFVPGLMLIGMGIGRGRGRWLMAVASCWVVFLLLSTDELFGIFRFFVPPGQGPVRVVTANCAGGNTDVLGEVATYKPDIVLLQESPDRASVERFARNLYGRDAGVVWSADTSIVARGELRPTGGPSTGRFVQARLTTKAGFSAEVICWRLSPPPARTDLWSAACWRGHIDTRRQHRAEVFQIVKRLQNVPRSVPVIAGGDSNAPAGDAALRLLAPRLVDAFILSGTGWGNTFPVIFPVIRQDQVWVSNTLRPLKVQTGPSQHSDHRLVIVDLERVSD